MTVTQDLDIWTLILHASIVVKVVMGLLIAVSFMSWMFIFQKWFAIRRANAQTDKFEREFWSGNDLNALYQGAVNHRHTIGSLERIFEAGYREFTKLRAQRSTDASTMVDGARRAMRDGVPLNAAASRTRALRSAPMIRSPPSLISICPLTPSSIRNSSSSASSLR